MLLSFSCSNFGPFKDEVNFSMKPGKTMDRFEDNVINVENKKVSKVAVIVGENAGGKTNFIKSLDFIKLYLQSDTNSSVLDELCYNKQIDVPQKFEIEAIIGDCVYLYGLVIDKFSLVKEYLYVRNVNQNSSSYRFIFNSDRSSIDNEKKKVKTTLDLNDKYISKDIDQVLRSGDNIKPGLIINLLNKLGVPIVAPFVDWISNKLIVKLPTQHSLNFYKSIQKNDDDLKILNTPEFLEIFSLVDPSIKKIVVDEVDPFRETTIIRDLNDSDFTMKLKDDSTGVNDFFAWSIEIYKVIYEDVTLFADELDKVLNSILATRVLNFVKSRAKKGQFIFSTHNVLHINTIDFMKEQIYFVNKDLNSLSSTIYPLSSFKDYRYEKSNVYELYLKGLLGGVPND